MKRCLTSLFRSDQIRSVAQSCPTLWDPMNCSTPGLPVHYQLPECTQTLHIHQVSERNTNKNYNEVSPHSGQNGHHQKHLQATNAGKDVAKREPSYNVDWNANWYSYYKETVWRFLKKLKQNYIWLHYPTTEHRPEENHNSKKMHAPQCSLKHCIQQPGQGSDLNVHQHRNG